MRQKQTVLDATNVVLTQSIIGWKFASVYVTSIEIPKLVFVSTVQCISYGVDAKALCITGNPHAVPDNDCTCGFHAWQDKQDALGYLADRRTHDFSTRRNPNTKSHALLRVGLYNDVIEGTLPHAMTNWTDQWAYRAESQLVYDIEFEKKCFLCSSTAVRLGTNRKFAVVKGGVELHPLRMLCTGHIYQPVDSSKVMKLNDVMVD